MVSNRFRDTRNQLIEAFQQRLAAGEKFKTITQARSLAESIIGEPVKAGTPMAKAVEEAIEQAIVLRAKDIISLGLPTQYTYSELVNLYESQPTLGTRTSNSVQMQAYSTTMPLSYLAGVLAGVTKETSVYEPTAGRGALLMLSSPENVIANELDPDRAKDLRAQGYQVTQHDAALYVPNASVDVVIANPPFGRRKRNGILERFQIGAVDTPIQTSEIDQAIVWKALEVMKDDGRAVLIIGSERGTEKERKQKYNVPRVRKFFFNLYRQYKVENHITVDGALYKRQGAAFPVDIIVVAGRKLTPHLSSSVERALPAADIPKVYESYEALGTFLSVSENEHRLSTSSVHRERRSLVTRGEQEPFSGANDARDNGDPGRRPLPESTRGATRGDGEGLSAGGGLGELGESDQKILRHRSDDGHIHPHAASNGHHKSSDRQSASRRKDKRGSPLSSTNTYKSDREKRGNGSRTEHDSQRVARPTNPTPIEETMAAPNEGNQDIQLGQVPYKPKSRGKGLDSYVPQNLESAIQSALNNLAREVGDVDQFVTDQLSFGSVENLHKALAAEQVDGVALAIRSLQQEKAALIGDDTGLGKGRQMASAIKYASERGYIPIFITKDPGLYADMVRDLRDIGLGASDIRPFMTNSSEKIPLPDGRTLTTSPASHQRELVQMMERGTLLSQYNMIFSTYDQIQTIKGRDTDRRKFLYDIAPQSILILDEAHAAGGSNREAAKKTGAVDRATFTRLLVHRAQGVFFASATATKRPEVMDLYAMRMNIAEITSVQGIQRTLENGGTPLQQVSTAMMAEDGQYIRRARTYAGVEVGSKVVQTTRSDADQLSEIMRAILEFDKEKIAAVKELNESARAEAKAFGLDNSTGRSGAMSTGFSSIMWNVVDQAALARKADAVADYAIDVLQANEKPFIGLSNTMGSFIDKFAQDVGIKAGDAINVSFQDVLARYLERSRDVSIKDYSGRVVERRPLTESELSVEAVEQYQKAERLIDQASFSNMPVSPIDWIRYRIESAGYSFGELTGRKSRLDYDADGNAVYQNRSAAEISKSAKIDIIKGFNSGTVDVGLGNRSASTGYSMHSSEKFSDQRRRHFLIAQPERDINVFKQFMGRFHRTGQVNAPKISLIVGNTPDEKRPAAVLAKKLASLNANTTAARQGGIDFSDIPDYLNEVGDQVVSDIMRFDAELSKRLHDPIFVTEDSTRPVEGAVAKVTGCLPMLPVAEQEAFYKQLDREYKATLDRYKAMGENPLEATSVDLDARTIGSVEVVAQKDGYDSVFAQGIRAEVVDAKVLSKPKPQIEVINDIRKAVGLSIVRTVEEHDRDEVDVLSKALVNNLYEQTAKVSERYIHQQKIQYSLEEASMEKQAGKADQTKTRVNKQLEILTQIKRFRPGQTVRVTSHNDRVLYGTITGVKKKGQPFENLLSADNDNVENAATPSRWEVVIAIADSQRQIALPLSKMNTPTGGVGTYSVSIAAYSIENGDIYELFDKRQKGDREVRTILTGNLLRLGETTYQSQGDLIVATRSNGKPEPMLLMKPEFNLQTEMQTTPVVLPSADSVHQFMQVTRGKGVVQTLDRSITFKPFGDRIWLLQTGKPRKDIFLDEGLLDAGDTEFVSVGDRMEAQVSGANLDAVMTYLRQEQGQSVAAFSDHEVARDLMGIKLPEIQLTDAVETVIEREGLAPSVDMGNLENIRERLNSAFKQEAEPIEATQNSQEIPDSLPFMGDTTEATDPADSVNDESAETPEDFEFVDELFQRHDGDIDAAIDEVFQEGLQLPSESQTDPLTDLADEIESNELPYDPSWDEYDQPEEGKGDGQESETLPSVDSENMKGENDTDQGKTRQSEEPQATSADPIETEEGRDLITPVQDNASSNSVEDKNSDERGIRNDEQKPLEPSARHRLLAEKRVVNFLHQSGLASKVTAKNDLHIKIENSPWIPLVVEAIGAGEDKFVYLTHYIEQNGDRFHDGEMVFKLRKDGHLTFHESAARGPMGEVRGYDKTFAAMFAQNIIEQGFIVAAKQQLSATAKEENGENGREAKDSTDVGVEQNREEEPTLPSDSKAAVEGSEPKERAESNLPQSSDKTIQETDSEEQILLPFDSTDSESAQKDLRDSEEQEARSRDTANIEPSIAEHPDQKQDDESRHSNDPSKGNLSGEERRGSERHTKSKQPVQNRDKKVRNSSPRQGSSNGGESFNPAPYEVIEEPILIPHAEIKGDLASYEVIEKPTLIPHVEIQGSNEPRQTHTKSLPTNESGCQRFRDQRSAPFFIARNGFIALVEKVRKYAPALSRKQRKAPIDNLVPYQEFDSATDLDSSTAEKAQIHTLRQQPLVETDSHHSRIDLSNIENSAEAITSAVLLPSQKESLEEMTFSECKQAMRASLYVEDQRTHSALEALLHHNAGSETIALTDSLKSTAEENLLEARVKYQNELSEKITPQAETILSKAHRAGITKTEGDVIRVAGKNYSVTYSRSSKTMEIQCRRGKAYVRSVNGITEEVQGLTKADCSRFAAFAQKTPRQLKRMIQGKNSGIEIG